MPEINPDVLIEAHTAVEQLKRDLERLRGVSESLSASHESLSGASAAIQTASLASVTLAGRLDAMRIEIAKLDVTQLESATTRAVESLARQIEAGEDRLGEQMASAFHSTLAPVGRQLGEIGERVSSLESRTETMNGQISGYVRIAVGLAAVAAIASVVTVVLLLTRLSG